MTPYNDRVAIVTGAASGIGRALCQALARAGAQVVAVDVNAEGLGTLAQTITARGGRCRTAVCDVTQAPELADLAADVRRAAGRIDILCNSAGLEINGEVLAVDDVSWQSGLAVDLHGVIHATRAVYPLMREQHAGHIVNLASLAGLVPLPGLAYYAAAKHGVVGFSLSLRAEARAQGVNVSVACPALVDTALRANTGAYLRRAETTQARLRWPRPISPENCAAAILKGVARNEAVIVVPWSLSWVWPLYRMSPGLFVRLVGALYPDALTPRDA